MSLSQIEIMPDEAAHLKLAGVAQAIDWGNNIEMELVVENSPARVMETVPKTSVSQIL